MFILLATRIKPPIAVMKERTDRIAALLEKSLREELTPEENRELDMWLSEGIENKDLFQQLTDQEQLLERLRVLDMADSEAIWQQTVSRINESEGKEVFPLEAEEVAAPVRRINWRKYAAAAAALVAISAVAYIYISNQQADKLVKSGEQENVATVTSNEIVPGGRYAQLKLADGTILQLDKLPDGDFSKQNGLNLTKAEGHLIYSGRFIASGPVSTGAEEHASLHNTVSTPRGGQYQITLPDGSRVWLNAASSLRFPLAFAGNQRIVEVTGEAYFEVEKVMLPGSATERMPFIVKINHPGAEHEVEVLGTHFNVKAYPEEKDIMTSLLEGSVRVKEKGKSTIIEPGQQAIARSGQLQVVQADVEDAANWKNGWFPVKGSTEMMLNQIARWYDVTIAFDANTEKIKDIDFDAMMPMSMSFEEMRKVLKSQNINTKFENRKLIVIP